MRLFWLRVTLVALVALPTVSLADWKVAQPGGHDDNISASPKAFVIGNTGYHTLGITCGDSGPFLYTLGYAARGGSSNVEVELGVDGITVSVPVVHQASDGLYIGPAPANTIEALKSGSRARLTAPGEQPIAYSLKGSSRSISSVLSGCKGGAGDGNQSSSVPDEFPEDWTGLLSDACDGGFEVIASAYSRADVDGDEVKDHLLDFGGLSCFDSSIGRGAGLCGINQCALWARLSRSETTQSFLGLNPQAVSRGFGAVALLVTNLRPSCPNDAMSCGTLYVWNGSEMEVLK